MKNKADWTSVKTQSVHRYHRERGKKTIKEPEKDHVNPLLLLVKNNTKNSRRQQVSDMNDYNDKA